MTASRKNNGEKIVFYCTRQDIADYEELMPDIFKCSRLTKVELPCSGRAGTGDILRALASDYETVVVLGCGVKSCIHGFGCREAKKAMERARGVAKIAGIDTSRLIFIEAEDKKLKHKPE